MADLVIRGMEMPKTCVQCGLKRYDPERIWTDNGTELLGVWVCKRTDEIIWNTQRGENCPLLPLPEGHGRLGDLDRLESFLRTLALYQSGERQQGILGCCETIKATTTIVQADVNDNYVGRKSEEGETDDSKL